MEGMQSSVVAKYARAVKGVDAEAGQRRRQGHVTQLRRERREEAMSKKRNVATEREGEEDAFPASTASVTTAAGGTVPTALDVAHLAAYVEGAWSPDTAVRYVGVRQIRRLLSAQDTAPVAEVLSTGVLPRLVEVMVAEDADAATQFEAAWAVTNIASSEFTKSVVEAGALVPLTQLMMSPDPNVREQALWCVGNIAGDRGSFRDMAYATPNTLNALLTNIVHPESTSLLRNAAWALSNFCRGKPAVSPDNVANVLPALVHLLGLDDMALLSDTLWGLSYLTDSDNDTILVTVAATGCLGRVVELLGSSRLDVVMPALRILGNFVGGTEADTQAALDAGLLAALQPLIANGRRNVRREACWIASNVGAGTPAQISRLVDTSGMLDGLLANMRTAEWNVRQEATWTLCNMTVNGTPEHVCRIMAAGFAEALLEIMRVDDVRMLTVALDSIAAVLAVEAQFKAVGNPAASYCRFAAEFEEWGVVSRLAELQEHESVEVYRKALHVGEKYYSEGGEGGENQAAVPVAPSITASATGFKVFAFGGACTPTSATAAASVFGTGTVAATNVCKPSPFGSFGGGGAAKTVAAAPTPFAAPTSNSGASLTGFGTISFV